jgi:hypothetical protein
MDQPGAQYSGESIPEQPKADPAKQKQAQAKAAQRRQAAARAQQVWQQYQAKQKQIEQQRVQETIQLKNEAKKIGSYDAGSAVLSTTTGADLSEQTVVRSAMEAAQDRREREAKARQKMAKPGLPGQSPSTTKTDDQDSLQRQAEQALGE